MAKQQYAGSSPVSPVWQSYENFIHMKNIQWDVQKYIEWTTKNIITLVINADSL